MYIRINQAYLVFFTNLIKVKLVYNTRYILYKYKNKTPETSVRG